jgi:hypothetical protein
VIIKVRCERNLTEVYHQPRLCVDYISGLGTTTRNIPNQFIPVGKVFCKWKTASALLQLNIRTVKEGLLKKMKVVQFNV